MDSSPTGVDSPAVLLIVFNRPKETAQILERVRLIKPHRLYIAGDGPRLGRIDDHENCREVRRLVAELQADCDVFTRWSEENLGIADHPPSAISWFFENEDMGIILEDDCLPSPDFFKFAREMLLKFQHNHRVMLVSGFNVRGVWEECEGDYFFSNLGGIWGWASWRRAWNHFDAQMKGLEELIDNGYFERTLGPSLAKVRVRQFLSVQAGEVVSWAIPWGYSRNRLGGLAVVPRVSLIENIGFSPAATNTKGSSHLSLVRAGHLRPPYEGPPNVVPDMVYDEQFFAGPPVSHNRKMWLVRVHLVRRLLRRVMLGAR